MFSTKVWSGSRTLLCCLSLFVGSFSSHSQSANSGSNAGRGRPPVKQPPKREHDERFAKANQRRSPRQSASTRVTADVSSNGKSWELTATPSGLTTPVATAKRAPVDIAVRFPLAKPGEKAVVTLLNEGKIAKKQRGKGNGQAQGRPGRPRQSSTVLTPVVRGDRTVRFTYHFGKSLHNQKIEAKVGLARAILNLHLHDGSDGH